MPGVIEAITFIALAAQAGALGAGIAAVAAAYSGALIGIGLSVGLSALSNVLLGNRGQQNAPRPEDVQSSARNPVAPRMRHYGQVKTSGSWIFAENKEGSFYKLLAIGEGPIAAVLEYWIDDTQVSVGVDSIVTTPPWSTYAVSIYVRFGNTPEVHYSALTAAFPEWTSNHKGSGIASLLAHQPPVPNNAFLTTFPNGIFTNYRLVIRGAIVLNPVTSVNEWNDNAAAVILDFMKHADGMRLPSGIFNTAQALANWQAAYTASSTLIALKGGGSEWRYRLWGSYRLDERPADVLGRMLVSCDGRLFPTSDGGLALHVGGWAEPSVTLDEDAIVGFADLSRGRDILSTANTIRATYTDPEQDYQTADADPWVDADDVSDRGEIAADASFIMSPSHSQCRRLMKIAAYRANPTWVMSLQCNARALAAIAERYVRVTYPRFGIDAVFEVIDFRLLIGEGNILQGVQLQLQSMPEDAFEWDPEQEEGDAPETDETDVDDDIPDPTGFETSVFTREIGGGTVFYALLEFDLPPSPALKMQARGKRTADSDWIMIAVADGNAYAESFALADGEEYEFQIRHVTTGLREGDWTASETETAA